MNASPSTPAMYQVIARKYRPQGFGELIGQEHVQKTLANAIESGRIAHGYIFSGQRGTGKTSVARIFARCLNCINGPTATPCGVCSACVEISAGGSVDVIEIDAASNRGINEMREIRENVRYRPARDRYKVFIVDEAHQITREAFNALLKTLEEPPEWVVFILCTTEASEIPNTIASRCQHFVFRSVDFAEIIGRMKFIAAAEGIEASDEVLSVLAQAGEGSVRDSLSAMDQAIACCGKTLRVEDVRGLLGLFGSEVLLAVANAIQQRDGARMLAIVEDLECNGQSLQHFARELSRYWRNLLVAKISGQFTRLIAASDAEQKALIETAGSFSEEDLTRYLHLTLELYKTLQSSLQPRLHLELGLIKLVQASRLRSIEEALSGLPRTGALPPTPPPVTPPKPPPASVATGDLKQDLYKALSKEGMNVSADAIEQAEVVAQGAELIVRGPKSLSFALKDKSIERLASQILGKPVRIRFEPAAAVAAPVKVEKTPAEESDLRQRALSHPGVKRFQELFPEAQVRAVRNLSE
jgi:DNA polymerase III subunit gamma/tau